MGPRNLFKGVSATLTTSRRMIIDVYHQTTLRVFTNIAALCDVAIVHTSAPSTSRCLRSCSLFMLVLSMVIG